MSAQEQETPVVPMDLPDGLEYVEPEVRDLARGIAADIRAGGHWQGGSEHVDGYCILTAPTFYDRALPENRAASDRLGELLVGHPTDTGQDSDVPNWNDRTPTPVVLATLDRIAEGLA